MKLQEMPERYRLYEEEPWYSKGLSRMPATNELMDKLDKGRKTGDENGWTLHEDMR